MIINELPIIMLKCLLLTIIIEVLISFILGIKEKKDILNIILVNVITNPLVVSVPIYIMIYFGFNSRIYSLIILEVLAVLTEGLIYYKALSYRKINPFFLSCILNGGSFLIGEVINRLL